MSVLVLKQVIKSEGIHQTFNFIYGHPPLLTLILNKPKAEAGKLIAQQLLSEAFLIRGCNLILIYCYELIKREMLALERIQIALKWMYKLR